MLVPGRPQLHRVTGHVFLLGAAGFASGYTRAPLHSVLICLSWQKPLFQCQNLRVGRELRNHPEMTFQSVAKAGYESRYSEFSIQ